MLYGNANFKTYEEQGGLDTEKVFVTKVDKRFKLI